LKAVWRGAFTRRRRLYARTPTTHILMKVETHNHPTAIARFGCGDRPGGESATKAPPASRQAQGRTTGFTTRTSHSWVGAAEPACFPPGKGCGADAPNTDWQAERIASALSIMLKDPSAPRRSTTNARLLPHPSRRSGEARGYHKPTDRGRDRRVLARDSHKRTRRRRSRSSASGMLIGLGGAASSMATARTPPSSMPRFGSAAT
jgi:phosphoribosylformylglycinamidine synthase